MANWIQREIRLIRWRGWRLDRSSRRAMRAFYQQYPDHTAAPELFPVGGQSNARGHWRP